MYILQLFKILDLKIKIWPLQKISAGPCKKELNN